jgi:DNA-binding response OmpR family regulator
MAKILIADDDADIRQLLTYLLSEEGHQISVCKDGRASIETMVMDPPELLVLDIMMPEMDGWAVLKEMSDYQVLDSTRILVLTAKGTEFDRQLGFELGADEYLTKPFEPDEILAAVTNLLDSTKQELADRRVEERDRAHLLSQLETMFDEVETPASAMKGPVRLDDDGGAE